MVYIVPIEHMIVNLIFLSEHVTKTTQNQEQTATESLISKVVHAIQLDSILRYGDFLQDIHQVWVIQHEILRQALRELILPNIEGTKEVHQAQFPLEPKEIINIEQIILLHSGFTGGTMSSTYPDGDP